MTGDMILMYGAAPFPDSPRVPEVLPYEPFDPFMPPSMDTERPVSLTPASDAVAQHLLTDETLLEVEHHCAAMARYLSLPREQRIAVDRHVEAARMLMGTVDKNASVYQVAQRLAEGLRAHPSRAAQKVDP